MMISSKIELTWILVSRAYLMLPIIDVLNWKDWKLQSSLDSTITICEWQKQKINNILLFIVLDCNYKWVTNTWATYFAQPRYYSGSQGRGSLCIFLPYFLIAQTHLQNTNRVLHCLMSSGIVWALMECSVSCIPKNIWHSHKMSSLRKLFEFNIIYLLIINYGKSFSLCYKMFNDDLQQLF